VSTGNLNPQATVTAVHPQKVLYVRTCRKSDLAKMLDQKGFCTVILNGLYMVYQDQTLAMGGRCDGRTGDPLAYTASVRVTIDSDQSNEMGAGQDLVGTTCFRADVSTQVDDTCLLADVSAQELEDDTCLLADVSAQEPEDDTCLLADVSAQEDDTCLLAGVSAQAKTLYEWHCALGLPRSNSCDGFIHPAAMTAIMVTHTLG
jgi:hypothetical protein